jgi:hypothetical protein
LDAPLLPPPSDDEGPPAAAVTPMVAGTDVGTKAGNNAGKSAGESMGNCAGTIAAFAAPMPPAVPTQTGRASAGVPESAAAAAPNSADPQDEHDALQRASHWRSRGECHAALLAWLIADAGDAAPWDAWHALAGDAPYVERLREDWFALGPAARWQVFDTLIARQRSAPAADRTALLAAARGLAPSGAARLRLLLLRRTLRLSEPPPGQLALEDLAPAFAAATTLLAQLIGPRGPAWAAGVGNEPIGVAAWATPWNAFPLRRLHAMQRPRVARAWAQSAAEAGLLQDAAVVGPLVAACRCLDTPVPATLAG